MYDEGRYRIKATAQALTENKKGNPEVQITFLPIGVYEPNANTHTPTNFAWERRIFLTLTDATIGTDAEPGWVLETLRFLGFAGHSFTQLDPEAENGWSCVGMELDALCKHDNSYDGTTREKWSILRPNARAQVKVIDKKSLRQLDAKYGKLLKATASAATNGHAGQAAEPAPASPADDEIPF